MKLLHLRNATCLLSIGPHHLLVDPMLSDVGAMPGFKLFGGGRRRNPIVPLPAACDDALSRATGVLLTHEHPDHFDGAGRAYVKERKLPVFAACIDVPHLVSEGFDARAVEDGGLGFPVEVIPSRHGRGLLGYLLGPVGGYVLAAPGEPSVYLVGDSILTDTVRDAITRLAPDVVVAPAGSANMGLGGDILFSPAELEDLVRLAPGKVVLNHLESLDHCPTSRADVQKRMAAAGLLDKVLVPLDGEELVLASTDGAPKNAAMHETRRRPGLQKWLTAPFSGA